jgi:Uma2 family endonuclease
MLSIDSWLDEKPYKEVYDGAIHAKVSPQLLHFAVAGATIALLQRWAGRRGLVGPELRVYLAPGITLVPDVAFISHDRLGAIPEAQRAQPPIAPEIVVEIRSPDDRERSIRRKTELYLAHGAILVVNIDPESRCVRLSDARAERELGADEPIAHATYPDLRISVAEIFAPLADR